MIGFAKPKRVGFRLGMSFRTYQALHDLKGVALQLLTHPNCKADVFAGEVLDNLKASWSNVGLDEEFRLSDVSFPKIHLLAATSEGVQEEFLAATCLLLLDRFAVPNRGSDFEREWDAFAPMYRAAPRAIRAAIMHGLVQGRKNWVISETVSPSAADLISKPIEEVLAPLIALAKSMTPDEISIVARADYAVDVDRQRKALETLLARDDCRYGENEPWFPAEVVELVSHHSSNRGFVGCTAIMLINAIHDADPRDNATFRWGRLSSEYGRLEPGARAAIYTGFRYLYEADIDWDPFLMPSDAKRIALHSLIPA